MPNTTQINFLDELIGSEGTYFQLIQEDTAFDLGTKVLYLERAIHEECHVFLSALDKLYNEYLVGDARTANQEFIRALKLINDLCLNNPVKFGDYGTRPALTHYFGSLGDVNPVEFRALIQQTIEARVAELKDNHLEQIAIEKNQREQFEAGVVEQTAWRELFDLPLAQLQLAPQASHNHGFFDHENQIVLVNIEFNDINEIYDYIETLRLI